MLRLLTAALLLIAASLAISACGDDDSETLDGPGDTPTPTAPPDADETEPPQMTEAAAETADPTPRVTEAEELDACELMADSFVEQVIGATLEFKDRGLGEGAGGRMDVCYYHFGGSMEVVVRASENGEFYFENSLGDEVDGIADRAKYHEFLRTIVILRDGKAAEAGIAPSLTPSGTATDAFGAAQMLAEAMLEGF